jgi:hypothetical protein
MQAASRAVPTAYDLFCSGTVYDRAEREALETRFFSDVRLRNGTFKTTAYHRLDDLNQLVSAHLPADRPLRIMDVAVSSGITTAEWLESLQREGVHCEMVAGDLSVRAYLLTAGIGLRLLTDRDGFPLQYDIRGLALARGARRRLRLRHAVPLIRLLRAARSFRAALAAGKSPSCAVQPLNLVSDRLKTFQNLEVVEDDILNSASHPESFHLLRAANILNRVYFDDATLARMVLNLGRRLRQDGLLIVCRTLESGVNHGSIFRLVNGGRFAVVARLNEGSEIEPIVLAQTLGG